ncbi:MAG: hypothetical protein GKS00_02900 [Alphaproteobacteria bacterium]|nr:hypothetical protein [Alphaproteobacteria bacterium]
MATKTVLRECAKINASDRKQTVLFMPSSATSWSRMRPQLLMLHSTASFEPYVLFATSAVLEFTEECRQLGVPHRVLGPVDRHDRDHFPKLMRCVSKVLGDGDIARHVSRFFECDRISSSLPVGLLRSLAVRKRLRAEYRLMMDLIAELRSAAIFVQGDRELGPIPSIIKAGKDQGVPIVIAAPGIPSQTAMGSVRRGQPRFLTKLREFAPVLNIVAARKLPGQVAETPHGRTLFSPGWLTLTMHKEGMLSANPWCQGGGNSDLVLLDGARKARKFIAQGVPKNKLRIIGDLDMDPLFRALQNRTALRRELIESNSLDPDKPLYIYAVPSYAEQDVMSMETHLGAIEEILKQLEHAQANVVLSLHPKSSPDLYRPLAERHGMVILERRLFEILPAADLFLCGGSTTMEWAVLCEVPTIDIDYAGICDTELDEFRGVVHTTEIADVSNLISRFETDTEWRKELARDLAVQKNDIAMFDGLAAERFVGLVKELSEMSKYDAVRT